MRVVRPFILAFLLGVVPAEGGGFRLFPDTQNLDAFFPGTALAPGGGKELPPAPDQKLFDKKTVLVTGAILLAVPIAGYFIWWKGNDFTRFKWANEGWFDPDTYAGGADKASHFVASSIVGFGMQRLYENLGHAPSDARWLSIGVVTVAGLMVEAGDGFKYGGASWQDAVMNVTGGVVGAEIAYRHAEDAVGFRYGLVPPENRGGETGPEVEHYSNEIYTFDVKPAGILRRQGIAPGVWRYFMLSTTYATRGYQELPPDLRERDLGFEIGLNIPEILAAAGFPRKTWWQDFVYEFFNFFRVPYTAIGFRYDFNHDEWHGPNIGR